jgi:hypothetical protein
MAKDIYTHFKQAESLLTATNQDEINLTKEISSNSDDFSEVTLNSHL